MHTALRRALSACAFTPVLLGLPANALAAPGAPSSLIAARTPTNLSPSLSWTAPASPGTGIVGYNVYRGTTKLTSTPTAATSYTDTGAAQASVSYTVTAVDSTGEGPPSAAVTVVHDSTAPSSPAALSAVTPTNQKPSLSFTASTDALSGVVQYQVWRDGVLASTQAGTTFVDAAVTTTGSHSYVVKAVDAAGNIGVGASKTVVYDTLPPGAPTLSGATATNAAPALTWNVPTDGGGSSVAGYDVYRGGTLVTSTSPGSATSFSDTTVPGPGSYTYTVVAKDGAGNRSATSLPRTVQVDTTPPAAPGAPTAASPTNARPIIGFTAAQDSAGGSGVAKYDVYRSGTLAGTTLTTSFIDSAAQPNSTYVYTVTAVDAAGNESPANGSVTVAYDGVAPTLPTSLTAVTPTSGKPQLSWVGSTDAMSGVARYDVYRGSVVVGSTTGTTFTDAALVQQGSQTYTVKAVDAAGNVSAASTAKTVIYDVTAPGTPTVSGAHATNGPPNLSWTTATDTGGAGLARYDVYRNGVLIGSPSTPTATSFSDAGATAEGSYVYTVKAVDAAGNASPASSTLTVQVDTTAPVAPGQPAATSPTSAKPSLSFSPASDNAGGAGIDHYQIYRNGAAAGTSLTSSFVDSAAVANGSYDYTVRAVDAAGNVGPFSAAATVVYDTQAPPAPTGLNAVTPTSAKPALDWLTGGPDNLSGFDHYELYRGTTLVTKTTSTSAVDSLLSSSGTQSYTVKAVDAAGNASSASTMKTVVWDAITPTAPGKPTIPTPAVHPTLTFTGGTDAGGSGVSHYDVYRGATLAGSTSTTTYTDPAVLASGSYSYTVVTVDGAGNASNPSAAASVTIDSTPPGAPSGLTAISPIVTKPVLSWQPATDNAGGSGVARYNVYRDATLAGSSPSTTFTDNAATVNGTYSYTVRAVDGAGNEGAASAAVTVSWDNTPPPVPIAVTAPSPTGGAPSLSWSSGGPAGDFDHYDLYRGTVRVGSTTGTSLTDTSLSTSGTYSYTVKAVDVLGNASAPSAGAAVVYDGIPPTAPPQLTVATPTNRPALAWTASTDGGGSLLAGYAVLRDGTQIATTSATTLAYVDASVPDGSHVYTVRALDGAGNRSDPSPARTVLVDSVPPAPPDGVAALRDPTNLPQLRWTQASDAATGGSGIAGYRIYRSGTLAGSSLTASFDDTVLSGDDTYAYTVTAVDGAGNESAPSTPLDVLFDGTPPPSPYDLSVVALSTDRPVLTWASGGPDALSGFDHYDVLRNGTVIGTAPDDGGGGTFVDSGLARNGTYSYSVRAVDVAGAASAPTATMTATWDDTPPPAPGDVSSANPTNRPSLSWTASVDTGGAGGVVYHVYRDGQEVGTTVTPAYVDHDRLAEAQYSYQVQAIDAAGNASPLSAPWRTVLDITPPPQVGAPIAVSPTQRPSLTWNAVSDASGIAHYDVYRNGQVVAQTTVPSFLDTGVSADGTYAYTVVAVDAATNESAPSPPLNVTFDRTAPHSPTQPTAASPTAAPPALTWQSGGVDNLSGFDHYTVYRDGDAVGNTTQPAFLDSEIVSSGAHVYSVRAFDRAGNASTLSPPQTVVYDTLAPPVPGAFTIPTPARLPSLTWTASNDDATGGSGVVGYRVYRDGRVLTTTTAPAYTDASLGASGSHAYWVTAVDAVGNQSLATQTLVVYADLQPPPAPADLAAPSPAVKPSLSWAPDSDDTTGHSGIDHYNVYRDDQLIATVPTPGYVDTHVTNSGRVTYTVRAVDGAGNVSDRSAPVSVDVDVRGPDLASLEVPRQRNAGETVVFSVSASDPEGSRVNAPVWSFGDGSATGSTVTHVYRDPGVYAVSVAASDALGNATTSPPVTITILPALTQLKLGKVAALKLKPLRRNHWRLRLSVTVDQSAAITISLAGRRGTVAALPRNVTTGTTPVVVTIPKQLRRRGTFTVKVTADGSALRAGRTVTVR